MDTLEKTCTGECHWIPSKMLNIEMKDWYAYIQIPFLFALLTNNSMDELR